MSGELETIQPGPENTSGIHLWLVLWKAFYALQARAMADKRKDLVQRRKDERDARTRIIHLTEAGRALIEPAFHKHAEVMNRLGEF
jgi:hypothetical protein